MRKLTNRGLVVVMALSGAIVLGAFQVLGSVENAELRDREARANYDRTLAVYTQTIGVVEALALKARTSRDWEDVLARALELADKDAKAHLTLVGTVGLLEALANERDRLFWNAAVLYRANQRDPGIADNVKKAYEVHVRAQKVLKTLKILPSPKWNLAFHYRKAYEEYRSLAFLDPKAVGEALDILNRAVRELRLANDVAPKNNMIELAIEFLYKRNKEEEARRGSGAPTPGPPRALPDRPPSEPQTDDPSRPRRH